MIGSIVMEWVRVLQRQGWKSCSTVSSNWVGLLEASVRFYVCVITIFGVLMCESCVEFGTGRVFDEITF